VVEHRVQDQELAQSLQVVLEVEVMVVLVMLQEPQELLTLVVAVVMEDQTVQVMKHLEELVDLV
tara:strand:+ start:448 stop:639 length:192 start_codon:yes stop_codon:yes gene_type:complete